MASLEELSQEDQSNSVSTRSTSSPLQKRNSIGHDSCGSSSLSMEEISNSSELELSAIAGVNVNDDGNDLDVNPSILVTSPAGNTLSPSEQIAAPFIIVTSPSDGSIKDLSPPATSMSSISFRDPPESFVDSDGEDYYEEYHLPNTHESAFVRHQSFRKKVQKTDINAPEAERIEGLVRTGEFVRHGSIRRKIVPEEDELQEEDEFEYYDDDDENYEEAEGSFSSGIERGIKEIEKYLSDENMDISYSDDNLRPLKNRRGVSGAHRNRKLKRSSSTPVVYYADTLEKTGSGGSFFENAQSVQDISFNEFKQNVTIEDSTLKKIKECLDFSSYRDLLNLSGKLSDLLSPKEVEEVLAHSERYRDVLDTQVFEALSLSYQANIHNSPGDKNSPVNRIEADSTSSPNNHPDSGFSSPKTVTDEEKPSPTDLDSSVPGSIEDVVIAQPTMSLSASNKVVIPAPIINLDSSTESKIYESEDDDQISRIITGQNNSEDDDIISYKRMISVTEGVFDVSDNTHIDGLGYLPRTPTRPRSDSMNNLEETNLEDLSSLCLSPDSPQYNTVPSETCPMPPPDLIPELSAADELSEERHWRNVVIGGMWRRIDMKVITPYKKCVSHGGYLEVSRNPVVVISASSLPDRSRKDYNYVMDNLFMYVLSFVEQLAADDYVLVYLAGGRQTPGPGFQWMRKAYEMIDRRLRKNLKTLFVVHPSLWTRTLVALFRPFISSKFYRKLHFIQNLTELAQIISLDQLDIPDSVKQVDFEIMIKEKKKIRN